MSAARCVLAAALGFAADASAETLATALARAPVGSWVEYRVPIIDADRSPCCWNANREATAKSCTLDGRNFTFDENRARAAHLAAGELRIFLKRGATEVERVQAYGSDCPVDVSGATVVAVGGIAPADSLGTLARLVTDDERKARDGALMALASHDGAVPVLRAIVESDRPKRIRRDALFWLGQVGDEAAFAVFDELLAEPAARGGR